jgi:steroid 5-alpha reductase family enzyme
MLTTPIAIFQNIILFIMGLPAYFAVHQPHTPLVASDIILAVLVLANLVMEFTSDNQQYSFQTFKRSGVLARNDWIGARIKWTSADAKRGFATRGLWAWSRHPNFLCEQTFWVRTSTSC